MVCKHLYQFTPASAAWSVSSCSAQRTPYVPSLVELESFCRAGRQDVCPARLASFSRMARAQGECVALEEVW